jgi:hypothetical protein
MLHDVVNGLKRNATSEKKLCERPGITEAASFAEKLARSRALMAKPAKTACRNDRGQPRVEVGMARSLSDHSVVTL